MKTPIGCLVLIGMIAIMVVLSGTSKTFSFGATRQFAGDLADLVREKQYTDHELGGAKTLAEAQKALDEGHAAIVTADAKQEEANNGKLIIFALIVFLPMALAVAKKLGL